MDWTAYWNEILRTFDANPPDRGDWGVRESAFFAVDRVFQDPHVTGSGGELDLAAPEGILERVFEGRLARALARLRERPPRGAARVTQIYNAGFLLESGGVRVGVDLKYPSRNDPWSFGWDADPRLEDELAAAVDVLLLSHHHSDHADEDIWRRVLARGVPVVSPLTLPHGGERHIRLGADRSFDLDGLAVTAFRSPHVYDPDGTILHFAYELAFPGGFRAYLAGDLDHTRAAPRGGAEIDLLALKAGGVSPDYDDQNPDDLGDDEDAFRLGVEAFDPGVVLCAHVGELGHPVGGGRERFATALACARAVACPAAVLFWGESLEID